MLKTLFIAVCLVLLLSVSVSAGANKVDYRGKVISKEDYDQFQTTLYTAFDTDYINIKNDVEDYNKSDLVKFEEIKSHLRCNERHKCAVVYKVWHPFVEMSAYKMLSFLILNSSNMFNLEHEIGRITYENITPFGLKKGEKAVPVEVELIEWLSFDNYTIAENETYYIRSWFNVDDSGVDHVINYADTYTYYEYVITDYSADSKALYDDFETGTLNLTNWANVGAVSAVQKHTGSYSYRSDSTNTMYSLIMDDFIGATGIWVVEFYIYSELTAFNDDTQPMMTDDDATACVYMNAGYPTANNWGYVVGDGAGWLNSAISSTTGNADAAQSWLRVRFKTDHDSDLWSVRFGSSTSTDVANKSFASHAGCVGKLNQELRIDPAQAGGEYVYFDDVWVWDYELYGWEGVTSTCTYGGSGDWEVELSDHCRISDVNIGGAGDILLLTGDPGSFIVQSGGKVEFNTTKFAPDAMDNSSIRAIETGGLASW